MCLCGCVHSCMQGPVEPRRKPCDWSHPVTGASGDDELLDAGAGTSTWALFKKHNADPPV